MSVSDKNVLFLATAMDGGGMENHYRRLAPLLLAGTRSRHLVCLMALNRDIVLDGLPVTSLGYRRPWHYPAAAFRLARYIRHNQIDLVYAFMRCSCVVASMARLFTRRPFKLVAGVMNQEGRQYDLNPSRKGLFWLKRAVHIYKHSDLVTCNSHSAMEELANRFGVPRRILCVVGNPLPEHRKSGGPPSAAVSALPVPYILCATRLVEAKGVPDLLRAFAAIHGRIQEHLVLAGDGILRGSFESLCDELGIRDRVHFVGWVDDLGPYYERCSLFITASHSEGLPNAVLEAMNAGAPVISAVSTSWIEQFARRGACLAVPVGDVPGLSEAMLDVIGTPGRRGQLAERGLEVAGDFRLDKVVAEYDRALLSVLDPPPGPGNGTANGD